MKSMLIENISSIVRSAIAAVGGPLAFLTSLWAELEQNEINRNVKEFLNTLEIKMEHCEDRLGSLEKKTAADDMKTLKYTILKVIGECEDGKISYYSNMLLHCLLSQETLDKKIQIIDQFSRLCLRDIKVLEEFKLEPQILGRLRMTDYNDEYLISIIPSVAKLESCWLLEEVSNPLAGFNIMSHSSRWADKCYQITSYGKALLDLIENIDECGKLNAKGK